MKPYMCGDDQKIQSLLEEYCASHLPKAKSLPRELREILDYIHSALFDPDLTVSKIRVDCRIRNNNVSSHFRHAIGRGIKEYIEFHRMQAARRLLCYDEFVVFDVAMSVGYKHVETFYKAFERHHPHPPAEYGRLHRQCRSREL